ncbi:hypothetical protein BGX27_011373 [Mortierella sp. AM989]|nr:hypothetical protein BGX27_011373 [Mortierella sp. AM989]
MGGQLFRKTLARRDYKRAFKLYSVLTTTLNVSEELVWKIGCEFLMQKQEYEPLCLRFLQLIFAKAKICKASILVETALYQLRLGKVEDAHITLEPYLNMYPYNENPVLLGYAGIIEFTLWSRAIREQHAKEKEHGNQGTDSDREFDNDDQSGSYDDWLEDEGNDNNDSRQWTSRVSRLGNAAANLLEQALQKNPKNDMFLIYLVRVRCGNIGKEGLGSKSISRKRKLAIHEMKAFLKRFYSSNNDSILSLQLLAALENREKQQTLELILNQDPAADSKLYVQPLLKILEKNIPPGKMPPPPPQNQSQATERTFIHPNADLKYFRPILKILLSRAEFGVITAWEERELVRICNFFCTCSLCCRYHKRLMEMDNASKKAENISFFDRIPEKRQPPWYGKLAAILSRK